MCVHRQRQRIRSPGQNFLARVIVDNVPRSLVRIVVRLNGKKEVVIAHRILLVANVCNVQWELEQNLLLAKEEGEGNIVGGDVVSPRGLRYDSGDGDRGASEMNLLMTEKNIREYGIV